MKQITDEDVERERAKFEIDLLKGRKIARKHKMTLTKFKKAAKAYLKKDLEEDMWTFDYESYLLELTRAGFKDPTEWVKDYYQ
jgi:hypothetical protein